MAFNVIPLYRNIVFKLPHIFGSLIPQGTLSFASQVYVSVPSFFIYISLPLLGSIPLDFYGENRIHRLSFLVHETRIPPIF